MAKFEITFERVVTQIDRFTRVIEAETMEEANERAEAACSAFDRSCPDDAEPYGGDTVDSWDVHDVEEADPAEAVDDLPD
jgi:hypothetical protein